MPKKKSTSRRTKTAAKKKSAASSSGGKSGSSRGTSNAAKADGKHLVIVESPTKARTINKYLGKDYVVMASVGHVRDLPSKSPKGENQPVPGVDLEHEFEPTYEVLPAKKKTVNELKRAAKNAADVWFATDLDREGEAIAWHLAKALDIDIDGAKRVVFNAITRREVDHAFNHPRQIDQSRVDAQQARRVLDRIVGYQVSPLLWKKVASGLSAGRVQSVAVRLVVEREREIEAFVPDEYWRIGGIFATETDVAKVNQLAEQWLNFIQNDQQDKAPTQRDQNAFLADHGCLRAELVELDGEPFKVDNQDVAVEAAKRLGVSIDQIEVTEDPKAKGPAQRKVTVTGHLGRRLDARVRSIETRRTTTRPPAPFITSTLQQAASTQLGFSLTRTMRIAQALYEGVNVEGAGQVGLITYMRTDSTHLSNDAISMAREHIHQTFGEDYLPKRPNTFTSSNKSAQEAHEAIRPTDVALTPEQLRPSLNEEQFKLYQLIYQRFLACQMTPAQWDSTTVLIDLSEAKATFKATGRTLVFDGFYRATGVPRGDEAILPPLEEGQSLSPLHIEPTQHFTNPPPRYTEASLQKKLEEEGIGRPSTYAAIIQTIQDRRYVEQVSPPRDRRLYATDLGRVVTDKLVEAFPQIMDVAYTREMESELDHIEEDRLDWRKMLKQFYGPFSEALEHAHEQMTHAKAETEPAPHTCPKCSAQTVYRFGKNGRFLSCGRYPDCDYAAPIDREGNPREAELTDILCPLCGEGMTRRTGRYGPFLGCVNYPECKGILNIDRRKHHVVLPKPPPLLTDVACPKCDSPLNLRDSKRGLWLSCSKFPKCRGRVGFNTLDEAKRGELEAAWQKHLADNPQPQVRTRGGKVLSEHEPYVPRTISGGDDGGEEGAAGDASDAA